MIRRAHALGLALAILGLLGLVLGLFLVREATVFAYLAAWTFGLSLALGALVLLVITHACAARWHVVLRRLTELVSTTLPVFAALFVPLVFALPTLYPWARPLEELPHHLRPLIEHKRPWLNVPFFAARAAVYFGVWIAASELLFRASLRQPRDPSGQSRAMRKTAYLSTWPLALTLTFAAFDWLMSLEPGWLSTIYGVYFFAGSMVGALSVVSIVAALLSGPGRALHDRAGAPHFYALGRLVFVFVVFWAYAAFCQGMLIWIANLPHEVPYYLERTQGIWRPLSVALIVGHFAVPFFALLSYRLKRDRRGLAAVAAWMIALHAVDVAWLVLPAREAAWGWDALVFAPAVLFVVGVGLTFGCWRAYGHPVIPDADPGFIPSVRYDSA